MIDQSPPPGEIMLDEVEPPKRPWGRRVTKGDTLRLIDLEGQRAVDTAAGTTRFMASAARPTISYATASVARIAASPIWSRPWRSSGSTAAMSSAT
jgi:uncharacterized protein YcgI (DUF1989 family)